MKRLAILLAVTACGGDDGTSNSLSCDLIPTCYADAVTALRACVDTPALTLGTPMNNSGVVDGLMCTGGDLTIGFSSFSYSATGTVPLPSTTTITKGGFLCAEIKQSTGTHSSNGSTLSFRQTTIEIPGATESVAVNRYDDATIGVECGPAEITASPGSLSSCATQLVSADLTRDDMITMMGVDLVDAADTRSTLFTCTR